MKNPRIRLIGFAAAAVLVTAMPARGNVQLTEDAGISEPPGAQVVDGEVKILPDGKPYNLIVLETKAGEDTSCYFSVKTGDLYEIRSDRREGWYSYWHRKDGSYSRIVGGEPAPEWKSRLILNQSKALCLRHKPSSAPVPYTL